MALAIRDVEERDLDAVLALNNTAGAGILATDPARLRLLFDQAHYFRVAEMNGVIAGFLIAFRADAAYDSPNYRWFQAHYESFVYIDRIVIGAAWQGHGLGRIFYCDVGSYAEVAERMIKFAPVDDLPYTAEMLVKHIASNGYDFDAEFAFGLELILDGLEAMSSR